MNRTILTVAGVFSASSLLLVDSAIKGTALLVLAAIAAMILRRDSAATRHLVWLLAIVAMLVVPVLSAMLPQWRVLPEWASISPKPVVVDISPPSIVRPADGAVELPQHAEPVEIERPSATAYQPASELPDSRPALVAPEIIPESAIWSWNWLNALPLVWAIGFCVLILRLMAARLMLWNTERHGTVIWSSRQPAKATHDAIVTALEAVRLQLGIGRPVTLLIHPDKTIPVVWGILRCHLLLPVAARHWTGEQLRSVLLHELVHIKRRDTMAQLLAQIACALHWFNPLVWFAAWRLGVERERACDDLVLASGVRPSAYAGHLLEVVTGLSPARWTQSCGLAMARTSSLEGRLVAVLSENLNRRGVSVALAAIALAIAVGIAVPIAMLSAVDETAGGATVAANDYDAAPQVQEPRDSIASHKDEQPPVMKPKHESARSLFKKWQDSARTDGKIPGGALGSLARAVANFIKLNPTHEAVPKLTELLKRIDTSHDWTQADAVALLDDLTAIYPTLPAWAVDGVGSSNGGPIRPGEPLPAELQGVAWGKPAANGLRAAWVFDPDAAQHPLGTALKSRILFHNTGKQTVIFQTPDWHQYADHQARDAKGAAIDVSSTYWTRLVALQSIRLAPGEFAEAEEVQAIVIGPRNRGGVNWRGLRLGAWIDAKEGDEVTFLPAAVNANGNLFAGPPDRKTAAETWQAIVQWRIDREGPMPASAADREQLLRRVTPDLIGVSPTQKEIAAFVADSSSDALTALAKRLVPRVAPFAGSLPVGKIKFRVTAPDPDAEKKPRVVTGPGDYSVGDDVLLYIVQKRDGDRRVNEARIVFYSPTGTTEPRGKPHDIKLPDGRLTWAIAWERGGTVLRVRQEGTVRSYDFTNPAQVKETRFEPGSIDNVPEKLRDSLRQVFDAPVAPMPQEPQKPKESAQLKPATEQKLKWGEPANGLRMALAWPPSLGEPGMGDAEEFYLVVQNVTQAAVRLTANDAAPNPRRLTLKDETPLSRTVDDVPMPGDWLLQPREVAFLRLFHSGEKLKDGRTISAMKEQAVRVYPQYSLTADMSIEKAPAGAWTGKLATGETRGSVDVIPPKHKDAQALLKSWTTAARADGQIPGAVIGKLGESVKTFIKNNPTWETTPQLQKMLPRFDTSRDWSGPDAVALLDELAAVQDTPIKMALDHENAGVIRTGTPLPPELANAPWGEALPFGVGLRHAWLLEPRDAEHRLGTPLKARVLIHNTGKQPVVFRTRTWHQLGHRASDTKGAEIKVDSTSWTTIGRLVWFRLAPGEFVEVHAPGIGVGPVGNHEDWQNTRVGSWVEAKAGDEVTVTTEPLPLMDWNEEVQLKLDGEPRFWLNHITARLSRHLPFPAGKAERELLLYRVAMDLFGTPVSEEVNAAFVADREPTALNSLAERLHNRLGLHAWAGPLTSGPTRFRVLPADPDAAKKPRTASNPGRYTLNENATLVVSRTGKDERIVNMAHLSFTGAESHKLNLPDGYATWAAAWVRGGAVLWLQQKGGIRSYDFTNPAQVKETTLKEPADLESVPKPILDALRAALDVHDVPKQATETPKPAAAAPKKEAQR